VREEGRGDWRVRRGKNAGGRGQGTRWGGGGRAYWCFRSGPSSKRRQAWNPIFRIFRQNSKKKQKQTIAYNP
jgi:hypothetical protein